MRVLAACSLGGAGHFGPMLPLLSAAQHGGAEVLVAGPPAIGDLVERAGYAFGAGGEPPDDVEAPIREQLATVTADEASILANRDLFGHPATKAMVGPMEAICAGWGPDLVLRDPCEYASAVVGPIAGIPVVQVAISFAQAEWGSIEVATPALEAFRTSLPDELRASPYVTSFPASLDPSPFARTIRFHPPSSDRSPGKWWNDDGGPRIYMTFGTVLGFMSIARDVYQTALRAIEGLGGQVLLTVGHRFDASTLADVPPNVRVEAWVDQAEVLAEADLVVCHGGSGTVFGSLGAGVPVVTIPAFADQFENGRRVAAVGAGLAVEAQGAVDEGRPLLRPEEAPCITAAIMSVLETAAFRDAARIIAAEMVATPTAEEVMAELISLGPQSEG